MTRQQAEKIARCLENAFAHYGPADLWVVVVRRADGKATIIRDEGIGIYANPYDFAEEFVAWPGRRPSA